MGFRLYSSIPHWSRDLTVNEGSPRLAWLINPGVNQQEEARWSGSVSNNAKSSCNIMSIAQGYLVMGRPGSQALCCIKTKLVQQPDTKLSLERRTPSTFDTVAELSIWVDDGKDCCC